MKEFVAKMGREPILTIKTRIKPGEVGGVEKSFATLKPKSEEFDLQMRDYFVFLSGQLWNVLVANETGGVTYPREVYNEEVKDLEQLREKIIAVAIGERLIISARGKGSYDQPGDHFWDASKVDALGEIKKQLDTLISLAMKHFEVDTEEFFRKTTR